MKLLATTALEATWGSDEPVVFLGEWCRLYGRRAVWEKRSHEVAPYHWDDRAKLLRDHAYLKGLHDALLEDLARELGRRHGLDRPLRYWRMILDPWLAGYVSIIWDRWECVRAAFEAHGRLRTVVLDSDEDRPFRDYADMIDRVLDDPWNHRLCADVIRSGFADRAVVEGGAGTVPSRRIAPSPEGAKSRALRLADAALALLPSRDRAVFYMPYFPHAPLARLQLRLGQVPRWYLKEFRGGAPRFADSPARTGDAVPALSLSPKSPFEAFLFRRLVRDLPAVWVEDFRALRERARAIPLSPELILTANAHWGDDLFKVWSAERVHAGAAFVSMSHGGGLPTLHNSMSFEEEISDVKTTWTIAYHPKHVRLPPNKLAEKRIVSTKRRLAVIGCELPRYQYRAQSSPLAGQTLASLDLVLELFPLLSKEIREAFSFRPYPDRGWSTGRRLADRLGEDKISAEKSYDAFLGEAKVIVCTYPQTTFSEAMASGLPAILLYPARYWETIPEMFELVKVLRAAGIVFDDAGAAAAHLNRVWSDPDAWWDGPAARDARREFARLVLAPSEGWLERWTAFVKDRLR